MATMTEHSCIIELITIKSKNLRTSEMLKETFHNVVIISENYNIKKVILRNYKAHFCVYVLWMTCRKSPEHFLWRNMWELFLSKFAKLWKANVTFIMSLLSDCLSVCLFVCLFVLPSEWNNSVPIVRIFIKYDIWSFLENLSRKFKFG
jgi:hypothetical protein